MDRFDTLVQVVVGSSEANAWSAAVLEWAVVELAEAPEADGVCICGKTGLVKLFTIGNVSNGSELYPIGSVCVNQFGRPDLDRQVELFSDFSRLRLAILEGDNVALTSDYFSRAMLSSLDTDGAFTPDQWNGNDGRNDYEFLINMFNKRDKSRISKARQRKITALLRTKVFGFVLEDERLR